MLCKWHWIVLYTVHFTAFCLGGPLFPGHGVHTKCHLTYLSITLPDCWGFIVKSAFRRAEQEGSSKMLLMDMWDETVLLLLRIILAWFWIIIKILLENVKNLTLISIQSCHCAAHQCHPCLTVLCITNCCLHHPFSGVNFLLACATAKL